MNINGIDSLKPILEKEHLRERISPQYGDALYLHLADLLLAIQTYGTQQVLDILDFGAGISPYRSLFPNSNYMRADFPIPGEDKIDYALDESLTVNAPNGSFDMILSTQVLEHVEFPNKYLKECFRLLRPGGKLILTTHGIYVDHPCPLDLHRWTAQGLMNLCCQAGFDVQTTQKLTTDARALFFLYGMFGKITHRREFSFLSAIFALNYRIFRYFRSTIHRWADRFFPNSRTVDENASGNSLYINLLICAVK